MVLVPGLLLIGGCSGLGNFFEDTERLPGANPNAATGVSENVQRSRGRTVQADPILPEPGNVWPGPPQPLPSLSDVARGADLTGGSRALGAPTMRQGGSISMGEQNAVHGGASVDNSFSGAGFSGSGGDSGALSGGLSSSVPDPAAKFHQPAAPKGGGSDIVIPNGDGSSTVISPDGSVRTIKGTPK